LNFRLQFRRQQGQHRQQLLELPELLLLLTLPAPDALEQAEG
jgi:hypothetical protein